MIVFPKLDTMKLSRMVCYPTTTTHHSLSTKQSFILMASSFKLCLLEYCAVYIAEILRSFHFLESSYICKVLRHPCEYIVFFTQIHNPQILLERRLFQEIGLNTTATAGPRKLWTPPWIDTVHIWQKQNSIPVFFFHLNYLNLI